MLKQVSKETGKPMEEVVQELQNDWRFSAPRVDDIAVSCINPQDAQAALAPDFKEVYRRQWWTRIVSDALDEAYLHLIGDPQGVSRLIIILPLQHGKSFHVAQLFPAVLLGRLPTLRIGSFGYKQDFAKRSIIHTSAILRSPRFQERYPGVYVGLHSKIPLKQRKILQKSLPDTQDLITISYQGLIEDYQFLSHTRNKGPWKCGGSYVSGSWPSPPNGVGLDCLILEDPYRSWTDVESRAYNQGLWDAYMGTLSQRLQSSRSIQILCFTPWTNDDISNRIHMQWLKEGHKVKVIKFPAWGREDTEQETRLGIDRSYDTRKKHVYILNKEGKRVRTEWGEVLDPWKNQTTTAEGVSFYEQKKHEPLRERYALFELAPRDQDFDRFPPEWWKMFNPATQTIPMEDVLLSLDANAAGEGQVATQKHSFAACGVWCNAGDKFYRLDEYRGQPGYSDLCKEIIKLAKKWKGYSTTLLVEEAGHGRALCGDRSFLDQMAVLGYQVCTTKQQEREGRLPKGWSRMSKEEHWSLAEITIQQGRVYLPTTSASPVTHGWVKTVDEDGRSVYERMGFIEECQRGGHPNDRIDEMAQAICFLQHRTQGRSWVDMACYFGLMNRNEL